MYRQRHQSRTNLITVTPTRFEHDLTNTNCSQIKFENSSSKIASDNTNRERSDLNPCRFVEASKKFYFKDENWSKNLEGAKGREIYLGDSI